MTRQGAGLRQLQTLFSIGVTRNLTDGQLLERFAGETGESAQAAFAVLVERHGPMVLRVCRSVLDDPHDAEDVFQATFLILLRKAGGLWARDSLGPWLFQVARRTALHARSKAARRKKHERIAASLAPESHLEIHDELGHILHEEIARLPERFRSPVILCDLEGRSLQQAARHLGLPIGTVKSRLSRGRERLKASLVRRGLAREPGLPRILVPPALIESTIRAIIHHSTMKSLAGGSAAVLARGVLIAMSINQVLKVAAVMTALGAGAAGVGRFVPFGAAGEQRQDGPAKATDVRTANAPADQTPPEADGPPSFAAVEPTVLTEQLAVDGLVEAGRTADLYSAVIGLTTILRIVPEGTQVKKGDFLCELDSAQLKDQLVNQTITVEAARASHSNAKTEREIAEIALAEYEKGILPAERSALEKGMERLQRKLKSDQAWLDRVTAIQKKFPDVAKEVTSESRPSEVNALLAMEARIEEARLKVENDEIEIEQIKLKKERLEKYTAPKTIKELGIELERKRSVELAKQAAWELARSIERKLQRQIAACHMVAPIEGTVIYANDPRSRRVNIEVGAIVRERQKILSVFDIQKTPPQIEVKIREVEVDRVLPGQPVQVAVKFPAGNHWVMGRIVEVAPLPDPFMSAEQHEKVYTTRVKLDQPLPSARPGMRAEALIELWKEKTLAVPTPAVVGMEGSVPRYRVAVKKPDGGLEWRLVTVGKAGDKVVEIKEGLKRGESVLANPYTLSSGNNLSGGLQRAGVWVAKDFPPLTQAPGSSGGQPAGPRRKGNKPDGSAP